MRGYTAKKGNRYYAVIYEGVDPATGKEHRRWFPAGTRRSDAERLVTEIMKRKNDGEYRPPDRITFGAYLTERWLPTKRSQIRPSTYDSYRRNIERHVIPALGNVPLQRLSAEDLDGLYAALGEGREDRRPLAPKTIRSIHAALHKALADAMRKGSVVRNIAELADPPKLSAGRKPEMKVWDAVQLRQFLDGIVDHRLHPAFYLAANTGMRRGEALGLRWADLDLDAARLSVSQAVISIAYDLQVADVKTGSSRRTIDLDPRTVAVLRQWKKHQLEERLLLGASREDHGLVFARPEGTPLHPDFFSQSFERLVAKSGLPAIRLHDLRHTCVIYPAPGRVRDVVQAA
ncbi:MAG: site-specific integrase [Acidimicrobiales bacterium]